MDGSSRDFVSSVPSRSRGGQLTATGTAVSALFLIAAAAAQTATTAIDLAGMETGQPPAGFAFGRTGQGQAGQWVVVDDPTAESGRAIAQTSQDRTDYRFPLAISGAITAANVDVTIRFKSVAGKIDQAGGIAVRLASPDNYYVARANALEDNVNFYRVVNGRRQEITGANVKVATGRWHVLALKADGDRFTVSFDGKQLYVATDKTFAEAGKVALWTKADSVTHFDRIAIRPLP
jgi:hypothetical protein